MEWEYMMRAEDCSYAGTLWTLKDRDGRTAYDYIQALGQKGWEMVSAVPIAGSLGTSQVLFIFKRPKK